MTTIEPRRIDPDEIKRWPVFAVKLVWKELPAWILLTIMSMVMLAITSQLTMLAAFIWSWFAFVVGVLLLEKADCNDSWPVFLAQMPRGLKAYAPELRRILILVSIITLIIMFSKSGTEEGITWEWLTDGSVSSFSWEWFFSLYGVTSLGILGIIAMDGVLSFPLRYIFDVPEGLAKRLNYMAVAKNGDTFLHYCSRGTCVLFGVVLVLLMAPFTSLLFPFLLALCYVACREIFIQPTKVEEKQTALERNAVPDAT